MGTERLRVGFSGHGAAAQRWRSALGRRAELLPCPEPDTQRVDALVLAPGAPDAIAQATAALEARIPVLYAAPVPASPWQAERLCGLSRRQACLLRFAAPFERHAGFAFLRRLLAGAEPFWRTLYLRATRVSPPGSGARIDELATEELAVCDALVDRPAQRINVVGNRSDDAGGVCALFLTVEYEGGPLVQCAISAAEPVDERRLAAVTPGRTLVLDWNDPDSPLHILRSDGQPEPATCAHGAAPTPIDPISAEVESFLCSVRSGTRAIENGQQWVRLASIWWAARRSLSLGGPVDAAASYLQSDNEEPPSLRVIEGGGKRAASPSRRPALTVVAG